MKKYYNVTLSVEVDSEIEVDINDVDLNDIKIEHPNATIKVVDVPESYEVLI